MVCCGYTVTFAIALLSIGIACDSGEQRSTEESHNQRGLQYALNALKQTSGESSLEKASTVVATLSQKERRLLAIELGEAIDRAPEPTFEGTEPAAVLKALGGASDPRWDIAKALVQLYLNTGARDDLIQLLRHVSPVSWPPKYIEEAVVFGFGNKAPANLAILIEAARSADGLRSKCAYQATRTPKPRGQSRVGRPCP
jgi:hypothetical protein